MTLLPLTPLPPKSISVLSLLYHFFPTTASCSLILPSLYLPFLTTWKPWGKPSSPPVFLLLLLSLLDNHPASVLLKLLFFIYFFNWKGIREIDRAQSRFPRPRWPSSRSSRPTRGGWWSPRGVPTTWLFKSHHHHIAISRLVYLIGGVQDLILSPFHLYLFFPSQ